MNLMILSVCSGAERRVDAVAVLAAGVAVVRRHRRLEHDAAALAVVLRLLRMRVVRMTMLMMVVLLLLHAVHEDRRHRRRL